VLRKLLAEPAFNYLRTQKQLGYIVSLSAGDYGRGLDAVGGIELKVLSKRFSPIKIEEEVKQYFQTQNDTLHQKVTEQDISLLKQSIITSLKDPVTSYAEEGGFYYHKIMNDLPFDWLDRIIEELNSSDLSLVEIQQFFEKYIYSPEACFPTERRSVAVMIFSQDNIDELKNFVEASSDPVLKSDTSLGQQHVITSVSSLSEFRSTLDFFTFDK
jgi:secreted Zn-dependent insulinase-like peptidase